MKIIALLSSLIVIGGVFAADSNRAWDDPAKAAAEDTDFLVQGEYVMKGLGLQVVALGGAKFDGYLLEGGLPGEGWDKTKKRTKLKGASEGGVVTLTHVDGLKAVIEKNVAKLTDADGKSIGELKRTERASPSLGAKPPAGAVLLFDGTKESLANWQSGARISDNGLLMEGVNSKEKFGDHTVHIEFRLPYQPTARGQGRGNSGMYLQGRHKVQMLDSFGLDGKDNECGGLYSVREPALNMCFPPLTWQTYDVDYTAAKFDDQGNKIARAKLTVRHNGVVIHKDVEVGKPTTAAPSGDEKGPGPLHLQNHGNPVRYRNIWIVPAK